MRRLLFSLLILGSTAACADAPVRVFVGVPPLQGFVEAIGGDRVQVRSLVQAGQDPHAFEPTPGQIAALGSADLYLGVGIPFEAAQLPRIRAANPRLRVLDARDGLDLRVIEAHTHPEREEGEGHPSAGGRPHRGTGEERELDPHVWTSPPLAKQIAGSIRDALSDLDPDHTDTYETNYRLFATDLDLLDREIRTLLMPLTNRRFLVYHPAWGYFADTYGLVQIPIERAGKEPGPRSLAAVIDAARREGVRVIFVQPQSSRRLADRVADAIGARVVVIDPLSPDYRAALRQAAREIATAAQQ